MVEGTAVLDLRVQNITATADANTAALENMGNKGEAAQRKLTLSSNPVSEAMKKQAAEAERLVRAQNFMRGGLAGIVTVQNQVADSSRRMTLLQMEAIAMNEKMSAGAVQHKLTLGRLGNQFESLIGQIAGVSPVVGKAATVLGDFALGSTLTVGILAGLAAIAYAYDKLTGSSRKAMEVGDKLAETYNRLARVSALGLGGQQKADIEDINKGLEQHNKWLGFIIAARTQLGALGGLFGNDPGGHSAAITEGVSARAAAEQQRVNAIGMQDARDNEAWAARVKDENDKAKAVADKLRAQRDRERSEQFLLNAESAKRRLEDFTGARQLSPVSERTLAAIPFTGQLTAAQMKHMESVIKLDDAYKAAKEVFSSTTSAVADFQEGLAAAATGLLERFSPSNIAQGLVTGLEQKVEGWIKGMLGGAVTGVRHFLFGDSGEERDAARKAADSARGVALGLDALEQSLRGNTLAATITQLQIGLISTLQSINDALPGTRNERERNAARVRAQALEAEQERLAATLHARDQQYATEDLAVRNLRATGQGGAADLLTFQNQQQREMQAAIDANRDATYLSYLATVQNNELIAYQNGLLSTAIRNAPTGFYGVAGYLSQYATPRGYPTDSGAPVNPVSPVNPTGGLTPPGGRSGTQTIVLTVDGKVLTSVVVGNVDRQAASNGITRADAFNRYQT